MDIRQILKRHKEKIDAKLEEFLDEKLKKSEKVSKSAKEVMECIKEFNLRNGKRLRPILTILSYMAFGGKKSSILDAALAVELMESYLLIHDDIIDQDEFRRGYLTFHKIYENKAKKKNIPSQRYGESMAIIAGDILSSLGSEAILGSDFPLKKKIKALEKFNKVMVNTCFGQILDMDYIHTSNISEKDVLRLQELKTAIYTIDGPLQIGAILAGASEKKLKLLTEFAIPLGKAFQIKDDILDIGVDGAKGRPVGSDIRSGKQTLLTIHALRNLRGAKRAELARSLRQGRTSAKELRRAIRLIRGARSVEYCAKVAERSIEEALRRLHKADPKLREEPRQLLEEIARYMFRRHV